MALNDSTGGQQMSAVGSEEPDPAEAARLQQLQQGQSKLNRKQRRRLQQQIQQSQQQQGEQTQPPKPEVTKQADGSTAGENANNSCDATNQPHERDSSKRDSVCSAGTSEDSNTTAERTQTTKGATMTAAGAQLAPNQRKNSPGAAAQPALLTGAVPLRPGVAHPLLHLQQQQQLLHLQQMRMAQAGGLVQPALSPQQLRALLSQIAQLQMVQQQLAAQASLLGKPGAAAQPQQQQQLFQQQQQIALMIGQMQQQVLQQSNLAGRFPSPPAPQPAQSSPKAPPRQAEKEPAEGKASEAPKPSEGAGAPASVADDRSKQPSPATHSRLQQWKQPLLQDQPAVSISSSVAGNPAAVSAEATEAPELASTELKPEANSAQLSAFTAPATISTNVNTPTESPSSGNSLSPRNRISDPVSSKWGVDAGPKLSADPPEFKPGVPWRPAAARRDDAPLKDSIAPATSTVAPQETVADVSSAAWTRPSQGPSPSSAPFLESSAGKSSAVGTNTAEFAGNPAGGPPSFRLPMSGASAWGEGSEAVQNVSKPPASPGAVVRPPPGLSSENSFPESPLFGEDPPMWFKNLINGPGQGVGGAAGSGQPEMQFSRFGFANGSGAWGGRGGGLQQLNPAAAFAAAQQAGWAPPKTPAPPPPAVCVPATAPGQPSSGSELPKRPTLVMSSWSANQPIASAQEKAVAGSGPGPGPNASARPPTAPDFNNPMSTWLVLRNLNPRVREWLSWQLSLLAVFAVVLGWVVVATLAFGGICCCCFGVGPGWGERGGASAYVAATRHMLVIRAT